MLNLEQMKQAIKSNDYMLNFVETSKEVYLLKYTGDIQLTVKRAIQWVEAGISDLDCRTQEEMLQILKSWEVK